MDHEAELARFKEELKDEEWAVGSEGASEEEDDYVEKQRV